MSGAFRMPAGDGTVVDVSRFDDARVALTVSSGPHGSSRVLVSLVLTDEVAGLLVEALSRAVAGAPPEARS